MILSFAQGRARTLVGWAPGLKLDNRLCSPNICITDCLVKLNFLLKYNPLRLEVARLVELLTLSLGGGFARLWAKTAIG